jgi:hypothetical protein
MSGWGTQVVLVTVFISCARHFATVLFAVVKTFSSGSRWLRDFLFPPLFPFIFISLLLLLLLLLLLH